MGKSSLKLRSSALSPPPPAEDVKDVEGPSVAAATAANTALNTGTNTSLNTGISNTNNSFNTYLTSAALTASPPTTTHSTQPTQSLRPTTRSLRTSRFGRSSRASGASATSAASGTSGISSGASGNEENDFNGRDNNFHGPLNEERGERISASSTASGERTSASARSRNRLNFSFTSNLFATRSSQGSSQDNSFRGLKDLNGSAEDLELGALGGALGSSMGPAGSMGGEMKGTMGGSMGGPAGGFAAMGPLSRVRRTISGGNASTTSEDINSLNGLAFNGMNDYSSPPNTRQTLNAGHRPTTLSTYTNTTSGATHGTHGAYSAYGTYLRRPTAYRRFAVGEYVLLSNSIHDNTHRYNLVNRYGYPDPSFHSLHTQQQTQQMEQSQQSQRLTTRSNATNASTQTASRHRHSTLSSNSRNLTGEERKGPYIYLLAQVTSVHFEEDAQYYTVRREDNGEKQRADAEFMEPLKNPQAIEAAKVAARTKDWHQDSSSSFGHPRRKNICIRFLLAILSTFSWFGRKIHSGWSALKLKLKKQVDNCLNGRRPYKISFRFTGVNFLVVCSFWYLFIDQLRLAFFPHSVDYAVAIVSCVVWMVLFIELMFEIFIRPDGYSQLIRSEKAYLPSTVRYLNTFHLISELISLAFFTEEFTCLFSIDECGSKKAFSLANCCLMSVFGPDKLHAFYGRAFLCMLRLRIFGLIRHWRKMWVNNTFVMKKVNNGEWRVQRGKGFLVPQGYYQKGKGNVIPIEDSITHQTPLTLTDKDDIIAIEEKRESYNDDDYHLTNATNIGTALLVTNSQRGLLLIFIIGLSTLIPVAFKEYGGTNQQLTQSIDLLQVNNIAINGTDAESCDFLEDTIMDFIALSAFEYRLGERVLHLLSLEVRPIRCQFQEDVSSEMIAGTVASAMCQNTTKCMNYFAAQDCFDFCLGWVRPNGEQRVDFFEQYLGIRPSNTMSFSVASPGTYTDGNKTSIETTFSVNAVFNEQVVVERSILTLFFLQLGFTLFIILSLSVLRYDAGRLVLSPLRRMLKIVAFYAKNPLSPPPKPDTNGSRPASKSRRVMLNQNEAYYDSDDDELANSNQLGTFETEKLIFTVTKITDLLRKCWGVAGAGIISSNLARQENGLTFFNPTVPGKAVYALFAFAKIDKFESYLHALKGDIMILINDIAAVLHEEVYRWGYENSGQCNKNLGAAFLMVYRIGSVSEVMEKREKAEAVIFSGNRSRATLRKRRSLSGRMKKSLGFNAAPTASLSHVESIDLSTLPGMRAFTDRALLGLLKTFVGIHRDEAILNWNEDFRLGAGVGAASINLIFGMDAGWAVEGAVGSSYKIDATYLSPHVNMASRMMSATKQYGVFILLSQAVERLLSEAAQSKVRHIDTVTVKGSSVQQKIFTYDAKVRNDFFLYSRTEDQADLDSERYTPAIWSTDQDLVAMRNHVSDEFIEVFNLGRDEYLVGNWPKAIELLKLADKIMYETEIDEGYASNVPANNFNLSLILDKPNAIEGSEERLAMGDGPCQRLISYMIERGGNAPEDWSGYRPLTSK